MRKLIASIGSSIGIGVLLAVGLLAFHQYRDTSLEEVNINEKSCGSQIEVAAQPYCECNCTQIATTRFSKAGGRLPDLPVFDKMLEVDLLLMPNFNLLDEINSSDDSYVVGIVGYGMIPGWIFTAVLSLHGQLIVTGVEIPPTHLLCTLANQRTGQIFYTTTYRMRTELIICHLNETLAFVPAGELHIGITDKSQLDKLTIQRQVPPEKKVDLSIVTMVYNEGKYIKEWIVYHQMLGVEKFWIIDNASGDETTQVLKPFVESGLVEVIYWPWRPINQPAAYNYVLYKAQERVEWLSWTDSDLYFLPVIDNTLTAAINRYSQLDIIYVLYISFGSSGYQTDPPGLVTENYTWRQSLNNKFSGPWKSSGSSWMRPSKVKACKDSHFAIHVDAEGRDQHRKEECCNWYPWYYRTPGNQDIVHAADMEILRANHYAMKSFERFEKHKKKLWNRGNIKLSNYDYFDEEDFTIMRFVPALRQELELEPPGEITLGRIKNITIQENNAQPFSLPLKSSRQ